MTDQPLPNVIDLLDRFRAALLTKDAATLKRLTNAYLNMYSTLKVRIDNLALVVQQQGGPMTKGQITRLAQYRDLLDNIEKQVNTYGSYLQTEIGQAAREAMAMASRDVRTILAQVMAGEPALTSRILSVDPRVVENLLAFLDTDGELFRRLSGYGEEAAKRASQAIIDNVGLGRGPIRMAADLRRALGMTLTDSLRTARTVQLWSYREATRANYIANSNIVTGWTWYAKLDGLTCASCVAQHGKVFPVDARLNDHYNGRCVQLPETILGLGDKIQPGEEWLKEQPEAVQKQVLRGEKWQAWKDGKFSFDQLSKEVDDQVYGKMRVESPLKDLIGGGQPGIPVFGSIEDAKAWINSNLKSGFIFQKGVNPDNQFLTSVTKIVKDIEDKTGNPLPAQIQFGGIKGNAFAQYDAKTNIIHFRKDINIEKLIQDDIDWKKLYGPNVPFHAVPTKEGVIYHEIGHSYDATNKERYRKLISELPLVEKQRLIQLSAYAGEDLYMTKGWNYPGGEGWAECVSAIMTNSQRSIYVPDIIKTEILRIFGK